MTELDEQHVQMGVIIDGLFCSDIELGSTPTLGQMADAVRAALKSHRGRNGLTRAVARAFSADVVSAALREDWCRHLAERLLRSGDQTLALDGPP